MANDAETLNAIYDGFNARNIEGVLEHLAPDVAWANAMEGGHVHGHDAVREYWTRQWKLVSPHVEPLNFTAGPDGSIAVEVRQTVLRPDGGPLADGTHGLQDRTVRHVFRLQNGKERGSATARSRPARAHKRRHQLDRLPFRRGHCRKVTDQGDGCLPRSSS